MTLVTITIASIGRPSLKRTLASIRDLLVPPDTAIDLVIADDSRRGAVARLVGEIGPLPFPVRCLSVGAANVAIARNACLEAATGDRVVFVDDDEWVAADWLTRLLAAMDEFEADCVFGPVHPHYPPSTPSWIRSANPLFTDWGARGRAVTVGRCGNTIVRRDFIERHRLRFSHAFGEVGGEDTEFFHRANEAGARMIVTDDALVYEEAPPHRLTLSHFYRRAVRKGQIYARFRTETSERSLVQRALFYADASAKAALALGAALVLIPLDRAAALRLAMRGWMNLGKVRQAAGLEPPAWT